MKLKPWLISLILSVVLYCIAFFLPAYNELDHTLPLPGLSCFLYGWLVFEEDLLVTVAWSANFFLLYLLPKLILAKKTSSIDLGISVLMVIISSLSLFVGYAGSHSYTPIIAPFVWMASLALIAVSVMLKQKPIIENVS